MTRPFAGVRVLDFTQVFAGPFGSYQLALLGADVVRVERPEGEDLRRSPPSKEWADRGMAPLWLAANANKRNLALDLKHPRAIEVVRRLVERTDVVMENFRPGVMDKLGIGYDALKAINPRLIYCAVSGFGRTGPEAQTPAYDGKIQAMSGIMAITGHPQTGPTRAGFPVCDAIGGMTAAFAVASALYQRTHTGQGQLVDVAMLDSALSFMSAVVSEHTVAGVRHEQYGNQAVSRRPTANLFQAKGGHLLLSINAEHQYQILMRELGRADLLDDPRFKDWDARMANEPALRQAIEAALAAADAPTWERRLNDAGAPCAAVRRIDEIVQHPQVAHRGVLQSVETPWGPITLVGQGFTLAHGSGAIDRAPAAPGEHSAEVLAEAGFSAAEIAALQREKAI